MAKNTEESIESLTLVQKLAKIRAISDVVSRDKRGYNYTYADITSILANISAGMKRYHVSLFPMVKPDTSTVTQNVVKQTKVDKTGKTYDNTTTEMLVTAELVYKWVNDDNPEDVLEVPWFMTGSQTDPSQAFGSGMTYSLRYFMLQFFQIAQAMSENDVDAYRSKQKEAEVSEDRSIAASIIEEFDVKLKTYLADHEDHKEDAKRFISRYVKNANYTSIKEPTLAAKLLEDFTSTFLNRED